MMTDVHLSFAGGVFRFHLNDTQMMYLEMGFDRERGVRHPPIRIGAAYASLLRGRFELDGQAVGSPAHADYSVTEMNAIIRAALLGGGGGENRGQKITWDDYDVDSYMRAHVHPMPLMERWDLALAIMGARIEGLVPGAANDEVGAPTDAGGATAGDSIAVEPVDA